MRPPEKIRPPRWLGRPRISAGKLMRTWAPLLSEAHAYAASGSATAHGQSNPQTGTTADGAPCIARAAIVAKSSDGFHEQPKN
jgi:hypothetical protein